MNAQKKGNDQKTKNNRGVAMLIAIFAMTLLFFIAMEVSYDTQVNYVSSSQKLGRLKAYYASKAGVEISLLRILIYKKALRQFSGLMQGNTHMLDSIWQIPLTWPPVLPEEASTIDKERLTENVQESSLKAQYLVTIENEGGKIDINDLGSDSQPLAESTYKQILQIFTQEINNNTEFRRQFETLNFELIVNNIADWIDPDSDSRNGGNEKDYYTDPIFNNALPPNQPFKTIKELHMVAEMQDDLVNFLKPRITIFGIKGININSAPKEVLQSLSPQITDEFATEIINRRSDMNQGGPFKDENDFLSFIEGLGVNTSDFNTSQIPLVFGAGHNFRIQSTGHFARSTSEIIAITYDIDALKDNYASLLNASNDNTSTGSSANNIPPQNPSDQGQGSSGSSSPLPSGRPKVVYWEEN